MRTSRGSQRLQTLHAGWMCQGLVSGFSQPPSDLLCVAAPQAALRSRETSSPSVQSPLTGECLQLSPSFKGGSAAEPFFQRCGLSPPNVRRACSHRHRQGQTCHEIAPTRHLKGQGVWLQCAGAFKRTASGRTSCASTTEARCRSNPVSRVCLHHAVPTHVLAAHVTGSCFDLHYRMVSCEYHEL